MNGNVLEYNTAVQYECPPCILCFPGASVVVVLVHAVFVSVPESSSSDPELGGIVLEDVTVS